MHKRFSAVLALILVVALALPAAGCTTPAVPVVPVEVKAPGTQSQFVALKSTPLAETPIEAVEPEEPEEELPYEFLVDEDGNTYLVFKDDTFPENEVIIYDSVPTPILEAPMAAPAPEGGTTMSAPPASKPYEPTIDYTKDLTSDTEEYPLVDENGFFSVETSPTSTFSASVDTASYANLRRMINNQVALEDIPDGAVRIEEILNYFHYDFIAPSPGEPFAMSAQVADCPWNSDTYLMVFGLQAQTENVLAEQGSNLVFLIDVSGSMQTDERLPLLKESFALLVDQLQPQDRISIVTYAGSDRVVLEGAYGYEKERILEAINNLEAGGSTAGAAGLKRAYAIAGNYYIEGGNNRIIMASDGDLNVGMNSASELEAYVSIMRSTGIYLSVLGFGTGNYKDEKMKAIAQNGNGNYHYIDSIAEAQKVFGEDLTANLFSVADDVKIQVAFNPDFVTGYRLVGYETRMLAEEDFLDDTKDAAELGAGHQVIVAYEVVLTDEAIAQIKSTQDDEQAEELAADEAEELAAEQAASEAEAADEAEGAEGVVGTDDEPAVEGEEGEELAVEGAEVEEAGEDGAATEAADTEDPSATEEAAAATEATEATEATDDDETVTTTATDEQLQAAEFEDGAWLTISLRYKDPGAPVSKGLMFSLDASAFTDEPDEDWSFICGLIEFGMIVSRSSYVGTATLDEAIERAQYGKKDNQYRQEFVVLARKLINN